MTDTETPVSSAPDPRTESLARQLEGRMRTLLDRVRRRFLVHGLGWMAAAVALTLIVYFLLDRFLDLPTTVRVILTLGFGTFLVYGFRRRLAYPLRRKLSSQDVAIAVENRFPELQERLISAVQLAGGDPAGDGQQRQGLRGQSDAMVARVVDEAADEISRLPTGQILDARRTLRVWGIATIGVLLAGIAFLRDTNVSGVFFARMLGSSASYPRETQLIIELPTEDPSLEIALGEGTASVTLAAGGDLPVLVRAEGVTPRDVSLVIDSGRGAGSDIGMTSRGAGRFRHVFRRIHQPFSFYAKGGDDPRGDRLVSVTTVEPPRVANIRAEIAYPAYTGRDDVELVGGGIEGLVGSDVRVLVRSTEAVRDAKLRFVDAGTTLDLTPVEIQDDSGDGLVYAGTFTLERSDRYQIEFIGSTGIGNPRPGTYPIVVQEDHAPIAKLVAPASDDILVALPDAVLPVRVFASDDFGVATVTIRTLVGEEALENVFTLYDASTATSSDSGRDSATDDVLCHRVLEVRTLGTPGQPVPVGETVLLIGEVVDNRSPAVQTTAIAERQVRIVSPVDLTRRISGHFRRIRESVEKALDLQRSRQQQMAEMLELPDAGRVGASGVRDRLVAIEVGQGRVLGEARRIHRELMRSFDVHLFNRLEESLHAAKVLKLYDEHYSQPTLDTAEPVDPEFYRTVSKARKDGSVGAMEKTLDPILRMIETADVLAVELGPQTVQAIEAASIAGSDSEFASQLEEVGRLQTIIAERLEGLRGDLDEWNEFQDVIQQARSIRDRQKDLRNRTRTLQGSTK